MMPSDKGQPEYETTDLNLTSFLRCRKYPIVRFRREGEARVMFVFQDSLELRAAIVDYVNDGPVSARSFSNTLRDLKALFR